MKAKTHVECTISSLKELLENQSLAIQVDGKSLTVAHLYAVANLAKPFTCEIPESSVEEMKQNSEYLAKKVENGTVIYGVNTGFGGSADVRSEDKLEIQKSLIRHLNAGFGAKLPASLVRATMLVRANSVSLAFSGVRPRIPKMLLEMLARDIVPLVPKRGSVSASGDLMPTSYIAASMMGREDIMVEVKGQEKSAADALREAFMEPITFQAKEALATINASSFASALAACVLFEANAAALLTQAATAMSVEAMCGSTETFHPLVHQCLPHSGQQEVAANIRSLLTGSHFTLHASDVMKNPAGALKQDRYALRTSPQWLGPVVETLVESTRRIQIEINSANDNPLIDHRSDSILHCGNFQGTSITVAMDQTRQSLQLCGKLLFAQMSEIIHCKLNNGLPPNLSGCNVSTDFGFKGMDTAMASYMSELDYLTNPISNHVLSAEMHNQGVNSLALISARLTQEALEILLMIVANILCSQLQAIDLRWLQKKVEQHISVLLTKYNINASLVPAVVWPWYTFLFCPRETVDAMVAAGVTNGLDKKVFQDEVIVYMEGCLAEVKEGRNIEDISGSLGEGE